MSIGPKTPYRRKNLADISYRDRVLAHFASNFVATATGVGRGKCDRHHSMAHPQNPSCRRKKSRRYLLHKPIYSPFCPKFRCHGNQGRSGVKLNNTIRLAIPENHTIEPKITTLSYTQPKLWPF